jgi:Zn-dependent alcohol dehydrogenase
MPTLGVERLATARFPLDRIEEAFAHATAGRGVKTIDHAAGHTKALIGDAPA